MVERVDNATLLEGWLVSSQQGRVVWTVVLWSGYLAASILAPPDILTTAQALVIVPTIGTAWMWGGVAGIGSAVAGIAASRLIRSARDIPAEGAAFIVGMVGLLVVLSIVGRTRAVVVQSLERRNAAAAAEARYRMLFERVPVGIFRTTPDGRFVEVNQQFAEMVGYTVEELATMDAASLYDDPQDRALVLDHYERESRRAGDVVRARHKNGSVVHVRVYGYASRRSDGELEFLEGIAEDVTVLKRSQDALQLSEERFRGAFEHAPVGMVLVNAAEDILRANAAFGRITDRRVDDLIGLNLRDLVHPEDHLSSVPAMARILAGEIEVAEFDERYLMPDGSSTWCETHISAARDASGQTRYLIAQVVDVDARKAVQQSLEQLVRAKDEFIASVSHELRTPLTVVHGLAHELRDHFGKFKTREAQELAGYIAEQSTEVAAIVEDLLVAARLDSGSVSVDLRPVDLDVEIDMALQSVPTNVADGVQVEYAGVKASADPVRLRQVLRNLLTNAERYGGSNVRITSGGYEDDAGRKWATVVVIDDGPGVAPEDEGRIFGAYESAHERLGLTESVGLGLTVSRQLARLMGGDLVYGRDDGLTMFALHLPAPDAP